jgi:hypothetical protein
VIDILGSVGDSDPLVFEPPDPLIRIRHWIQILPFSHKGAEQRKIMLAKQNFKKTQNFKK